MEKHPIQCRLKSKNYTKLMELYSNRPSLLSLLKEEERTMKSSQPAECSLQTYPKNSEPDIQFTPATFSSCSVMTPFSPLKSPWTRTHPSPSPTLLYQCVASLHRHEGNIVSIAVLQGNVFTGTESNRIRVWKQPDFIEHGYLKANSGEVRAIVAYGNLLFTAHQDKKVRVWSVRGNSDDFHSKKLTVIPRHKAFHFFSRKKTQQHQDCISCLDYYHAEGLLYTGSWDKTVKTWRVSDQRCIDSFVAHSDTINAIVVNQDDGFVFTCSSDGYVKIWRRVYGENSHTLTMTLKFQLSPVNALALSSSLNACYLYSASSDGFINFWEKEKASGRFNHGGYLQGHRFGVLCLATTERYIFSGSEDTTIRVWRREEGSSFHKCLAVLDGHRGPVRCLTACLEIDKDAMGFLLFTASMDGTFKVWRVQIFPEEHNTSNDDNVQCCSKMKHTEYAERCKHDQEFIEFEISPVLSPSWVEKKLQCNN